MPADQTKMTISVKRIRCRALRQRRLTSIVVGMGRSLDDKSLFKRHIAGIVLALHGYFSHVGSQTGQEKREVLAYANCTHSPISIPTVLYKT